MSPRRFLLHRLGLRLRRQRAAAPQFHRSSAVPLAWVYAALIVYASLYPFSGWAWPAGQPLSALWMPPWPRWHDRFDVWANFVGYLPMGALIYAAVLRSGRSTRLGALLGILAPSALSWAMEFTQHFLPHRYPSLMDWTLNSVGALAGVLSGLVIHAAGGIERWQGARERWLVPDNGLVLALLYIWPLGFLFPSPVPFGQGPSWERLQVFALDLLTDHPWRPALEWLWTSLGEPEPPLSAAAEAWGVALGLLGPGLAMFAIVCPGWRRAALAIGALCAGLAANALSSALNFGPTHAWAWVTPVVPAALAAGSLTLLACLRLHPRICAALALVALSIEAVLVAQAPSDPYYAQSLLDWEQGRFIRFHGLAEWVGWLWPMATGAALLGRLASPGRRSTSS